jgi:hypothetical protein
MNILPLLPNRIRKMLRKEAGRTIGCREKTNLVVRHDGVQYPLCSFCLTPDELKQATPASSDRDHPLECQGARIIGESGRDYRLRELNVDVCGLHTKDQAEKIRANGRKLFEYASALPLKAGFYVALVAYSDGKYRIFGSLAGEEFPIGSKLLLAELGFEVVSDRFEPARPRRDTVVEFDTLIRESVKRAVDDFKTDIVDHDCGGFPY